jgi:SAM-dependent methyltransferase
MGNLYDARFYVDQQQGSLASASVIVPIVCDRVRPTSVIDVGCGTGTWASVFAAHGVSRVVGVDGSYVDQEQLLIPRESFVTADLSVGMPTDERFDLAVCLEVGEHLPADQTERFVAELARVADTILFSAAIPLQGGTGHINERWQEDWANCFAAHGLVPVDLVRPAVWSDARVQPWYAQNTLVYVARDRAAGLGGATGLPLSVVHPRLYELQHARRQRPRHVRTMHRMRRTVHRVLAQTRR